MEVEPNTYIVDFVYKKFKTLRGHLWHRISSNFSDLSFANVCFIQLTSENETVPVTQQKEVSFSDRKLCDKSEQDFTRIQFSSEFKRQMAVRTAVGNFMS